MGERNRFEGSGACSAAFENPPEGQRVKRGLIILQKKSCTSDSIYYFPVLNLHIPNPFKIGNIQFTYFTKEYFDAKWEKTKENINSSKIDFDKFYRKYQGRVFASTRVKAEPNRAKTLAFNECSLAVDVLKMYTPTILFPSNECLVDLEERININYQSDYLCQRIEKPDELGVTMSARNNPFILTENHLLQFFQSGLSDFSNFLSNNSVSELSSLIKQSISFYSTAISTFDLHFRIAQLITISESILLEDDRKHNLEKYCKTRFDSLLNSNDTKKSEIFTTILTNMYQIRHKIMHKAIRLSIDLKSLSVFQISLIELLLRIIYLEKNIKKKEELILFIDKK